ncbi:hypothetical protein Q31a_40440 [Aureliella helgolandensis]|uniref:Uncharacterized protein n=1 Tax=Aureliella helgolandensis TaxID=2527968 RepID=A0A518GAZ2_9BACT|nr:hypothetical protein Q31a_40440 [Aureliella helgolandensis]
MLRRSVVAGMPPPNTTKYQHRSDNLGHASSEFDEFPSSLATPAGCGGTPAKRIAASVTALTPLLNQPTGENNREINERGERPCATAVVLDFHFRFLFLPASTSAAPFPRLFRPLFRFFRIFRGCNSLELRASTLHGCLGRLHEALQQTSHLSATTIQLTKQATSRGLYLLRMEKNYPHFPTSPGGKHREINERGERCERLSVCQPRCWILTFVSSLSLPQLPPPLSLGCSIRPFRFFRKFRGWIPLRCNAGPQTNSHLELITSQKQKLMFIRLGTLVYIWKTEFGFPNINSKAN